MPSLINQSRPPVFCPGCSHQQVLIALDQAFQKMGLKNNEIVMVSDIGCSGLFDTFFNTHAFHGLHGRALTYATGLKLARPELNVVVTMGDGGLGIGGAHLLSACRRNLDLTLLLLNNFNFGMTGGQYSSTTPPEAVLGSGFLNRLERPFELGQVAAAAGAPFVAACSAYQKDLAEVIEQAILFDGFALVEVQGVCPGRYTRRNKLTPKMIEENLAGRNIANGPVEANLRPEYGRSYRQEAAAQKPAPDPAVLEARFKAPQPGRQEVMILGAAGLRIQTAGDILGLAGLLAGLNVTQKSEYNITVLRGPSITDLILSPEEIDYTGSQRPSVVLALAREGVDRRQAVFDRLDKKTLVVQATGVEIPPSAARVQEVDFKAQGLKKPDWALASLAVLAQHNQVIT
ncbi:MAG: 2-oxoacid:acceptor oxidoreductase family protein, partial [Deltaproteobacteria bacterium]|nr:2-oxoacid:acceptor oxidoreductase family protein [Deltaproteobacteria bacterium]